MLSGILLIFGFTYLSLLNDCEQCIGIFIFYISYGFGCALFMAAYWPCVKLIVSNDKISTGYGLSYCMMNALNFISSAVIGTVIDQTQHYSGGYFYATITIGGISLIAFFISMIVFIKDYRTTKVLFKGINEIEFIKIY